MPPRSSKELLPWPALAASACPWRFWHFGGGSAAGIDEPGGSSGRRTGLVRILCQPDPRVRCLLLSHAPRSSLPHCLSPGVAYAYRVTAVTIASAKRKAPGEYSSHGPVTPRAAGVPSGQKWTPSGERTISVPPGPQLGSMLIQGSVQVKPPVAVSTEAPASTNVTVRGFASASCR